MKKVFTCAGGLLLSFAFVSVVYAGAIDNKTNWSDEYIRTLNRNAATDYADIAAYNPAGTVKLQDGFIINGSAQYLGKDYTNTLLGSSYGSDEGSVVPGLFGVYNKDKWSLFGVLNVVGGGGKVDFSQGNYKTELASIILTGAPGNLISAQLEAESFYLAYTIGGAYEVNDMFSFSVGLRYVDAHLELDGSITTNLSPEQVVFEQDGDGWGAIFGLNIAPTDKFNIGMRFETKTSLNLDTNVITDTATYLPPGGLTPYFDYIDGTSPPRDLPGLFAVGVSYWLNPKLRFEVNYTQYLNSHTDWNGDEDLVNDGYDLGIALEYHFNDSLLGSIGYLRTETGIDPENMLSENPELDADTFGCGIAYAINEKLHTNLSLGYVFYEDDSFLQPLPGPVFIPVEYEKKIYFLAAGVEYRF